MAPPPGPPPQINILESEPLQNKRSSRPISIQFGSSLDSEYCKALYDYDANGSDELAFKEDEVIHIISRSPNGVEDGWWMGELNGRTGLFPSIVVEECQANGDEWSPDVSLASPTSIGPPCFTPPPLEPASSLPPPPGPPPVPSDPPAIETPPAPTQPPTYVPPAMPADVPPVSGLMLPETTITITNPTPVVETAEEPREDQPQVSYHVENSNFSMNMSSEKKLKYSSSNQSPAVEIAVTCDDDETGPNEAAATPAPTQSSAPTTSNQPAADANLSAITFTEIMVTAPTPRTQSPVEEQISFTEAVPEATPSPEQSQAKEEGGRPVEEPKAEEDVGWANFQVFGFMG